MTAMQWVFSFLKKYRKRLIFAMFLATITAVTAIVNPQISGTVVDDVIMNGNHKILPGLVLIMVLSTLIRAAIRFWFVMIFEKTSQEMLYTMRDYVYRKFMGQDFTFYNTNRTGDLMSRQTGDMEAIRHFVAYVIYSIYENTLLFTIALVMIFIVEYRLALCMIAVMPLTIYVTYKQLITVKPAFHKIRQHFSSLNTFVQENVSGNRVVKAFAKEDFEIAKFNRENDGFRDAELNASRIWRKYVPVFEFLANALTVILYLVGGIMVVKGAMSLGKLVTVSGYLWMLNLPLRQAGWLANDYQRFVTSVEKVYSTISIEPTIKDPVDGIVRERFNGDIEFSNVSYQVGDEQILKDVSFKIKAGQTVGIIGSTGSGKTTLMNLLCRFYDVTSGEITLDNINIKDIELFSLRDNIGLAMQDVFLFSDTIEGNIAFGRPDCSLEEVIAAAKIANAHDFILQMPDGYDTIVGERGVGLSGGQKQRISLARALLKDPPIIILDDTTSAVDMETETLIQEELTKIEGKHTVFVIAHRISSIKDADLILVVEDGRILESGNHESLLNMKGYYHRVFYHQYGDFDQYKILKKEMGDRLGQK
ncbi:MAG: ABC transporter ATP-binding protein [Clostridiales bacterium]|jgi:ATP-binding cassette subfamily B multidrug efflux pump|nr:ABC transporter ATP-binding protein [Clostridiales bacterium]